MAKKKNDEIVCTKDWPYNGASKDICAILSKISADEGYNPLEIFRFFLQICHASLDRLPSLFQQAIQAQHQAGTEDAERFQDPPELAEAWRAITGKFRHPQTIQTFAEAFQVTWMPSGEVVLA